MASKPLSLISQRIELLDVYVDLSLNKESAQGLAYQNVLSVLFFSFAKVLDVHVMAVVKHWTFMEFNQVTLKVKDKHDMLSSLWMTLSLWSLFCIYCGSDGIYLWDISDSDWPLTHTGCSRSPGWAMINFLGTQSVYIPFYQCMLSIFSRCLLYGGN